MTIPHLKKITEITILVQTEYEKLIVSFILK